MKILLGKNNRFYKANLHAHTTLSDGKLSPEELKNEYKSRGYSVVAFTDHEHIIDNSYLNDEDFLAITGCELAIKDGEPDASTYKYLDMKVCHLNFYSLDPHNENTPYYSLAYDRFLNSHSAPRVKPQPEHKRVYGNEGINEIIKSATEQGFLVSYNHPSWSLEYYPDYIDFKNLFAVEIYNHNCRQLGYTDDEAAYDHLLRKGNKLYCTACDDCHADIPIGTPGNDSFGGWICIDAKNLEYGTIMEALKNGDFYSSTGPEILEISQKDNILTVKCSPAQKVFLLSGGRRTETCFAENGIPIEEVTFSLRKTDKYVRIRVEDYCGKKAYSNAYFL